MGISSLLTTLEQALQELYPTITFGLGEKDLPRLDLAPPRVVWIPTKVKHGAATKRTNNPRCLLTREVAIIAHCWQVDPSPTATPKTHLDACEALVHDLLVAIRRNAKGDFEVIDMIGEEWGQATHVDSGHAAIVTFVPHVRVDSITYRTVQLTTLEAEVRDVAPGDNNVDWGEPP